jgi:hypothetical protein
MSSPPLLSCPDPVSTADQVIPNGSCRSTITEADDMSSAYADVLAYSELMTFTAPRSEDR